MPSFQKFLSPFKASYAQKDKEDRWKTCESSKEATFTTLKGED